MLHQELLLAIVTLLFLQQNNGSQNQCSISLPQKATDACKQYRSQLLAQRRSIYGLKPPSPDMAYARLDKTPQEYMQFLKTEPFLAIHAKSWAANSLLNNKTFHEYMRMTARLPNVPELNEYENMKEMFVKVATDVLGDIMRIPSDFEPFQNDASTWLTDEFFAEQRVAGNNPMVLRQVTFSGEVGLNWNDLKNSLNPSFDWEKAYRQSIRKSKTSRKNTICKGIKKGEIFAIRYPLCDDLLLAKTFSKPNGEENQRDRWPFYSPIVLFASVPSKNKKDPKGSRQLKPFAIQMDYKPDSTVYTPKDNGAWELAKLNVQITDLFNAQFVEHLGKVHLTTEVLCISLERHLSEYHPIHAMMKYHCRGLLTANTLGIPTLLRPNGFMDQLSALGSQGASTIIGRASDINWEDLDLETNLKKRGLNNEKQLPYYPYRDDGRMIVAAITNMARDYVNAYYENNCQVAADKELQAFANEVSKDGQGELGGTGNFKGFPAHVNTKKKLSEILTRIIWLLTGQHAAVSYPVADYGAYPPNVPTELYNDSRGPSMEFSKYNLPYRVTTALQTQLVIGFTLRLDRLFDYGPMLTDQRGRKVLYKHHDTLLRKVEPVLDKRNKERYERGHLTYPYFLPRWLPNGIQT